MHPAQATPETSPEVKWKFETLEKSGYLARKAALKPLPDLTIRCGKRRQAARRRSTCWASGASTGAV
jgi:hypothetical protein